MSPIDAEQKLISGEDETAEQLDEGLKLVPVAESIRYRKRAQGAEKKLEVLAEQLSQSQTKVTEMSKQFNEVQIEREMMRKLSAAGVVDLETAVLVAKAKLEENDDDDFDGVIEQLKTEKRYLFGASDVVVTAKKTAGVKERMGNNQTVLERAAKKAATTGNRTDLQEYLKLRRNFV